MTRWFIPFLICFLIACGASVSPGGDPGGIGSASGKGSAPVGGPMDGEISAAQPLSGGFPAPSLEGDPGGFFTTIIFLDRTAECRESESGVYSIHFEGYVMPAVFYMSIAGYVLRLVDPQNKVYLDTELQDKGGPGKKDVLFSMNYTGYFEQRMSTAVPIPLKAFLLPPSATKDSLGKSLSCAGETCAPEGAVEVKVDFMDGMDVSKLSELPSCMIFRTRENSSAPLFNRQR